MAKYKITGACGETLAKRALWLAWQACGGPLGMGFLQDRPEATEDEVWDATRNAYDYSGFAGKCSKPGVANPDYVFGRMMKMYLEFTEDTVSHRDGELRPAYQAWCSPTFPTYAALLTAAAGEVGAQLEEVKE
jgi:hypothetical protein